MTIESILKVSSIGCSTAAEKAILLGNRAFNFIENHPAIPVAIAALGIFGSISKTAIEAGWSPEQVIGLSKSFPVQIVTPTLSL